MKRYLFNEKGLTLFELLATMVIIGITVPLIFNVLFSGQKEYSRQSDQNQELFDVSYSLKVFTKEIRQAQKVTSDQPNTIVLTAIDGTSTTLVYNDAANTISKNGQAFVSNVDQFSFQVNGTDHLTYSFSSGSFVAIDEVNITFKSEKHEVASRMIIRGGD